MALHPMLQFRSASLEDAQLLFNWRNDPITQMHSLNTEPVSWDTHINWLTNSLGNPKRQIYIAQHNNTLIGMLRGDQCDSGIELSWSIAPNMRGQGFGSEMLRQGIHLFTLPLFARIKANNLASLKIAKTIGFKQTQAESSLTYWCLEAL